MNEHDSEPVRGLPDYLPDGEYIVWQGEPAWRQLALRVFHLRKVVAYFVLLAAIHVGLQWHDGATPLVAAQGALWLLFLGAVAVSVLGLLARLYAKTTIYTMTNRRLVMRFGVALPMMINIPWDRVIAADLKQDSANFGQIALTVSPEQKLSYWLLWPHAKPWQFAPVRPMLRCLDHPQTVAEHLRQVVNADQKASVVTPIRAASPAPADRSTQDSGAQTAAFS